MKITQVLRNIGAVIAAMIIATAGLCFAIGYEPAIVMSGSMEPVYHTGSVLLVDKNQKNEVGIGDTIAFTRGGEYIAHRIVKTCDQGYITRGDANDSCDPWVVTYSDVKGKVITSIPKLGYVFKSFAGTAGMIVVASIVIALGLSTLISHEDENTGNNKASA